MLLREIMITDVPTLSPADSVRLAAHMMKQRGIDCVVVTRGGLARGIVTDRDVVVNCVAEGFDAEKCVVGDFMSRPLITASQEMEVRDAALLMWQHGIRRLPIVEDNRLVGLVSHRDLGRVSQAPVHELMGASGVARVTGIMAS